MAFPWLDFANFEDGLNAATGEWTTKTDTDGKLSILNYRELRQYRLTPHTGAFAAMIDLSKGVTNPAILIETGEASTGDYDTAADGTIYCSGYLYVKSLTGLAASDSFSVFVLDSAGPVVEVDVQIYNNAGTYQIRCGDGTTYRAATLEQNKWLHWELCANIDNAGADDGTIYFYLDGVQVGAQITGCDQAAITQARLGFIANTVAAGTTGYLVFDNIIADDGRVYPMKERFPIHKELTKTAHVFIGPGHVQSVTLHSVGATDTITLYDTDRAESSATVSKLAEVSTAAHSSAEGPWFFKHGCYAVLAGTNPRGVVDIVDSSNYPGVTGPVYYSDWGYKNYERR